MTIAMMAARGTPTLDFQRLSPAAARCDLKSLQTKREKLHVQKCRVAANNHRLEQAVVRLSRQSWFRNSLTFQNRAR